MTLHQTDVAIIGAGPAGLFGVFECGFLGYRCVVLDALPHIGGQLTALYPDKPIYDVPGYPMILAGHLIENLKEQAAAYAPTYLLGEPVMAMDETNGVFTLRTASHEVQARVVMIAGGGGMFTPRKPKLEGLEVFEKGGSVLYAVTNKAALQGQTIVLAGGGDSAVDWAIELAGIAKHVHVVHRRVDFRAAEASVARMKELALEGKITLYTPFELKDLQGANGQLSGVTLADIDGNVQHIPADRVVCCFGLAPNPGPYAGWGIGMEKDKIPVTPSTMATSRTGILAVGDIADYAGKLPLILTGFAEAALAAKTAQAIIHPDRKFKVQYSTAKGVPGR
ncbi:MAG TPA: NAD(P)/FAD-dependent oxidoreductase [Alphaproteobacteria bacterium]|nr:NAD(P)/FAD-dependent oxidoreductase [Alphaproteobacteria bacterium]